MHIIILLQSLYSMVFEVNRSAIIPQKMISSFPKDTFLPTYLLTFSQAKNITFFDVFAFFLDQDKEVQKKGFTRFLNRDHFV